MGQSQLAGTAGPEPASPFHRRGRFHHGFPGKIGLDSAGAMPTSQRPTVLRVVGAQVYQGTHASKAPMGTKEALRHTHRAYLCGMVIHQAVALAAAEAEAGVEVLQRGHVPQGQSQVAVAVELH